MSPDRSCFRECLMIWISHLDEYSFRKRTLFFRSFNICLDDICQLFDLLPYVRCEFQFEPLFAKSLDTPPNELRAELVFNPFEPENRVAQRPHVGLLEKDSSAISRVAVISEFTRYRFQGPSLSVCDHGPPV